MLSIFHDPCGYQSDSFDRFNSMNQFKSYPSCMYFSGGNATFPNILNNFVHICMYFYYMLSAMGPQYQKFLWWKKYMTELQIVSKIKSFINF